MLIHVVNLLNMVKWLYDMFAVCHSVFDLSSVCVQFSGTVHPKLRAPSNLAVIHLTLR